MEQRQGGQGEEDVCAGNERCLRLCLVVVENGSMNKKPVQKHLFHIVTLSLIIILMGGGAAFLYQWHQGITPSQASSDDVVGAPSLPAATVNSIFERLGSPMAGTGQAVEAASQAQHIDDAFALAVWWTETNDGAAGVGLADRNPGSVRGSVGYPSAYDGYTIYPSFTAAVNYWFSMMKSVYIDRGLTTVYAISHPYVGTSTSDLWAGKVVALMAKYRAEAPPPPTPTPTVPPDDIRNVKAIQAQATVNPITPGKVPTISTQAIAPQATPAKTTTSSSSVNATTKASLSSSARLLIVLFDLMLALVFGLWGWSMNRQSNSKARLSTLLGGNLQNSQYAGVQQSGVFSRTLTGGLRTTEELMPGSMDAIFLAETNPLLPTYTSSEALLSMGAFLSTQTQYQTPLPVPQYAEQLPEPVMPYPGTGLSQFARRPGLGLPSRGADTHVPAPHSLYQTPDWSTQAGGDLFSQSEMPTNPWEQPQPVSAGAGTGRSGGGLLSRYRETQTQDDWQR